MTRRRASTTPTPTRPRTPTCRAATLPFVPGSEVVGHVVDPGRSPAARLRLREPRRRLRRAGGRPRRRLSSTSPTTSATPRRSRLLVQGLTAWHLVRTCARVQPGESVVVHAAAGGVGNLAVQLAKQAGAGRVIATASSQEKLDLALDLGADVGVLLDSPTSPRTTSPHRLVEANGGAQGRRRVRDGRRHARSTAASRALAPFGRLVTFGMAVAHAADPAAARQPHGRARTRSSASGWSTACARTAPRRWSSAPLRELVGAGRRRAAAPARRATPTRCPHARHAHEDLRARRTTGKVVLDPTLDGAARVTRERRPRVPRAPPRRLRRRRARRAPASSAPRTPTCASCRSLHVVPPACATPGSRARCSTTTAASPCASSSTAAGASRPPTVIDPDTARAARRPRGRAWRASARR